MDARYLTNQSLQELHDTMSCVLGSPILFINITYQNIPIPFNQTLINRLSDQCPLPAPLFHATRRLRLLLTSDLTINYLISNPYLNQTELTTLLNTHSLITTLVQSWNAPPPPIPSPSSTNSNLAFEVGVPLGAIAMIVVVAVVQISLRKRGITTPPARTSKSIYVTDTPFPVRTLHIQSTAEEEERIGHHPLRIRI